MIFEQPDWHRKAACKGMGHDIFFPEQGNRSLQAQKICARCPVQQQCKDYAVRVGEAYGIWGGLTERRRRPHRALWLKTSDAA